MGYRALREQKAFAAASQAPKKELTLSSDNDEEKKIFSFLSLEGRHIDNLIENSNLSPAQVSATLLQLELRGLVRQLSGKMYISNCGDE